MRPERVHAHAVPEELSSELGERTAVTMMDDRAWLVHEAHPRIDQTGEHLGVTAAVGRRPGVERFIERAHGVQRIAAKRHVRARADVPRARRREWTHELAPFVTWARSRHAFEVAFEQALRVRLELERQHDARHA